MCTTMSSNPVFPCRSWLKKTTYRFMHSYLKQLYSMCSCVLYKIITVKRPRVQGEIKNALLDGYESNLQDMMVFPLYSESNMSFFCTTNSGWNEKNLNCIIIFITIFLCPLENAIIQHFFINGRKHRWLCLLF